MKAKKKDVQIKSKMKRLTAELENNKADKPLEEPGLFFEFENADKRGKRMIEASHLRKSFGGSLLFQDSSFYVKQGEKVGLIGPNGSGKTTLLKMILGEQGVSEGSLWVSPALKIGYLSQDVGDLPGNVTPQEALNLSSREDILSFRSICAGLGMNEETVSQKIENLSLGQRTRIKLAGLLLDETDLLILDEPTNHLDLPAREQLEETLLSFKGTLLLVSHDAYFMEKLSDKLLVFEHQQVKRHEEGLKDFIEKREQNSPASKQDDTKNDLLIIETKLAAVLGELSLLQPADPKFQKLDKEFQKLASEKRALQQKQNK